MPVSALLDDITAAAPARNTRWSVGGTSAWKALPLAAGYFALACLCIVLTREAGNIAALWLPNALVLGVLVRTRVRTWSLWLAALALGNLSANLVFGDSLAVSLAFVFANGLEVLLAAAALRLVMGRKINRGDPRHAIGFMMAACVVAPVAGATIGAGVVHTAFGAPYGAVWLVWLVGEVIGMLVLAPAIATFEMRELRHVLRNRASEFAILALTALLLSFAILQSDTTAAFFLIFPVMVWSAARFGIFGTSVLATILAVVMVWGTFAGWGPVAAIPNLSISDRIQYLQNFFAVTVLSGYVIAVFLEQRVQAERSLKLVTDTAPALISYLDSDCRYVFVNPRYEEWWRTSREQVIGRTIDEFLPQKAVERIKPHIEMVLSGHPTSFETDLPKLDGSLRHVEVRYEPDIAETGEVRGFAVLAIDQTERLQAERAARESQVKLDLIVNSAPALIMYFDTDERFVFASDRYLEWRGYAADDVIGRKIEEVVPAGDYKLYAPHVRRVLAGESVAYEATLQDSSGSQREVDIRYEPDIAEDGTVQGFVGLITDMTERQKLLQLLRQSDLILGAAGEGIYVVDLDGCATYVNPQAQKLLGYTARELIGRNQHKLLHHTRPDGSPYPVAECPIFAAFSEGEVQTVDHEVFWRKDGTSFPVEYSSTPLQNARDEIIGAVVVFRDISHRLEAEAARLRAEEMLNSAIVSMSEGFALYDSEDRLVICNDRYRDFYLGNVDILVPGNSFETICRKAMERGLIASAVGREEEWLTERLAARGKAPATIERELTDGRWVVIHESPLEDGSIVTITTEVTDMKAREGELRRSNDELEKFAYIASHDLQEPLRKVQAFGDRLTSRFADDLPDEGRLYVDRMRASAERMQKLIQDLLEFSRITTSGGRFETMNLTEVAREVEADLEVLIAETGAKITIEDLPEIEADAGQIRQLFQNLMANAVKFRKPEQAPNLTITSRPCQIGAGTPGIEISFADDGIGFDPKFTERIFEMFQRLHGRDAYEGTGVGLAICRKIVERHGGKIIASSAPGEGATFSIVLPLKR